MHCLRQLLGVSIRDHMGNKVTGDCCQQQPTGSDQIHQRQLQWFVHQVNYHTNYSLLIGTSNKNAKENMDQTDWGQLKGPTI